MFGTRLSPGFAGWLGLALLGLIVAGCSSEEGEGAADGGAMAEGAEGEEGAGGPDEGAEGAPEEGAEGTPVEGTEGSPPEGAEGVAEGAEGEVPEGGEDGCTATVAPSEDDQTALAEAFVLAAPGSVICLTEGTFKPLAQLDLVVENVTVRGAGKDKTILDYSGQIQGANGIRATRDNFVIEGLTVKNTPGDGVRVEGAKNVLIREVGVIWDADESDANGAYGLYPVQVDGVTVVGCTVKGARDAGIYVGQSTNILVIANEVYGNVAGIEIENSTDAEVTENDVHDNVGGILVFNLPNLEVMDGKRTKVHKNNIEHNNVKNFAPEGNIVGKVPGGTGFFILAADDNEFTDNMVKGNDSIAVAIIAYTEVVIGTFDDPKFDMYPEGNYVHDNVFEDNGMNPQDIAAAITTERPIPGLVWDGCQDGAKDAAAKNLPNCFNNNGDPGYLNINLCSTATDAQKTLEGVTCDYETLPELPRP